MTSLERMKYYVNGVNEDAVSRRGRKVKDDVSRKKKRLHHWERRKGQISWRKGKMTSVGRKNHRKMTSV